MAISKLVRFEDPTVGHLVLKARAMDDRSQLDNCILALCKRREELATQVSELENLRDRVAKAERRIVGAARKTRKAVHEGSRVGPASTAIT